MYCSWISLKITRNYKLILNDDALTCLITFTGNHKTKFIPQLIGPILEMTLVPEIGNYTLFPFFFPKWFSINFRNFFLMN